MQLTLNSLHDLKYAAPLLLSVTSVATPNWLWGPGEKAWQPHQHLLHYECFIIPLHTSLGGASGHYAHPVGEVACWRPLAGGKLSVFRLVLKLKLSALLYKALEVHKLFFLKLQIPFSTSIDYVSALYMSVSHGIHAEDQGQLYVVGSLLVRPGDQDQVIRLASKHCYPLSHHDSPYYPFFFTVGLLKSRVCPWYGVNTE